MSVGSRFGFGRSQVIPPPQPTHPSALSAADADFSPSLEHEHNRERGRPSPLSPAALVAAASSLSSHPLSPPDTIPSHSPPPVPATVRPTSSAFTRSPEEDDTINVNGGPRPAFPTLAMRALQAERDRQGGQSSGGLRRGVSYHSQNRQSVSGVQGGIGQDRLGKGGKKWLVLIKPPDALPHSPPPAQVSGFSHGYGASGRFSGGILLPLVPTLSGQLALIAREFSLPSLAGVSLYLCLPSSTNDSGSGYFSNSSSGNESSSKPRLVEEVWGILWAGFLDEESASVVEGVKDVYGLPIAGRIEFDIDPRKARWLSNWIDSAIPERPSIFTEPTPSLPLRAISVPESVPSSRSNTVDDYFDSIPQPVQPSQSSTFSTVNEGGRIPVSRGRRPFSLLHRTTSSISTSASNALLFQQHPTEPSQSTSRFTTAPSSAVGQPQGSIIDSGYESSPPISTKEPNSISQDEEDDWPPTPDSPDRLPSPDIGHRNMSFTPSALGFLLPAAMMLGTSNEEVPPVPTVPTGFTNSKRMGGKLIERDWEIKMRPIWECSGTPTPSPNALETEGKFDEEQTKVLKSEKKVAEEVKTFKSWIQYPTLSIYPAVYPHFDLYRAIEPVVEMPWKSANALDPLKNALPSVYPQNLSFIYPSVYPHLKKLLYPSTSPKMPAKWSMDLSPRLLSSYPYLQIFKPVYPTLDIYPSLPGVLRQAQKLSGRTATEIWASSSDSRSSYPHHLSFIYPPVYPHVQKMLYPSSAPQLPARYTFNLSPLLPSTYPYLQIFRPSYPNLDIYPSLLPSFTSKLTKLIPPPLVLSSSTHDDYPASPLSPERLESASLESRVLGSAQISKGPPELQFEISAFGKEWKDEYKREMVLVGRDQEVRMRSLAEVSLPSPIPFFDDDDEVDRRFVVDEDEEVEDAEFSDDNDDGSDGESIVFEDHLSPRATFSSLFQPPPSASFEFEPSPTPSPTLNASQINSRQGGLTIHTPTAYNPEEDLPFIISPRLGAALDGLDLSPKEFENSFPQDDEEQDDGGHYWVPDSPTLGGEREIERMNAPTPVDLSSEPVLFVFPKPSLSPDLTGAVVQYVVEAQNQSIQRRGRFCIALSGGSMVDILAEGLASDERIDWSKWEVFFVDERLVPLDHPDSTFNAYNKALFTRVPLPQWQIHSIKSLPELSQAAIPIDVAEEITSDYETALVSSFPDVNGPGLVPGPPRFDLCLLGMGPDGHTASLFPSHALLQETNWWVSYCTDAPKSPAARITFTLPLLNASRRLAFVCAGASKAEALSNALDQGVPVADHSKVPAGKVVLGGHPVVWFVDEDAALGVDYARSSFWED